MAPLLHPPRKRRCHAIEPSTVILVSDVIDVRPRKRVKTPPRRAQSQARYLEEKPAKANEGRAYGIYDQLNGHEDDSAPTVHQMYNVPSHCCFRCLFRSGSAARQCSYRDGSTTCLLCVKEKGKCRMPSRADVAKSEARCVKCFMRGFSTCDGNNPCDTCKRNGTVEVCMRSVKISGRNNSSRPPVRTPRPSLRNLNSRTLHSPVPEDPKPLTSRNQRLTATETKRNSSDDSSSRERPMPVNMASRKSPKQDTQLETSEAQIQIDLAEPYTDLAIQLADSANQGPEDSTSGVDVGLALIDDTNVAPYATHQEDCEIGVVMPMELPTRPKSTNSTSRTITSRSQVEVRIPPLLETNHGRPRRSTGRKSYVEIVPDFFSDQESSACSDSDSDAFSATDLIGSEEDSEVSEASELELSDEQNEDTGYSSVDDDDLVVADLGPERTTQSAKKRSPVARPEKGLDLSLPPLHTIEDIFTDITQKALELGLDTVVEKLRGRQINVATMCSGTEAPLIALDLLSEALMKSGHSPLNIKHHFSAEIDVSKQGFIERNFHPPIIFRDVREFLIEDAITATTAYGSEERIPTGLDILVAGFVCKDLSRLNSKQKDIDDDGESGDTWRAIYTYAKRFRPSIVLLENVKGDKNVWQKLVAKWDDIDYEAIWLICDTKEYYIPQTRERMYMFAVDRKPSKNSSSSASQWKDLMHQLRRQCSSPYESFLVDLQNDPGEYPPVANEVEWALSKLRYDHIRSTENLGILRPVTNWSENGTVKPPDHAHHKFFQSQSSRVYDAIDVAYLQGAKQGYDSLYKMSIWDVSQNVDRFKANPGTISCITPSGCSFSSNHQQPLSGSELLVLQGMPMNKLLFARETPKDCQDLAGNAMTTTVIGASLVSALISSWRTLAISKSAPSSEFPIKPTNQLTSYLPIGTTNVVSLEDNVSSSLDVIALQRDALFTARMCTCEGHKLLCTALIRRCSSCGHTACARCAGNPKHMYDNHSIHKEQRHAPDQFITKWKSQFPSRLALHDVERATDFLVTSRSSSPDLETFVSHVTEASLGNQQFIFSDMVRCDKYWKVTYRSDTARLELRIGSELQWLLFVQCPKNLATNSPLRSLLQQPLARATVTKSLLGLDWELRIPTADNHLVKMTASEDRISSWRSRLGLPDYRHETVPSTIQVNSSHPGLQPIAGNYTHLPECGTACSSLYRRVEEPSCYMFLDPDPIGRGERDTFVFSRDCAKKHAGDIRMTLAQIDASWRHWDIPSEKPVDVKVQIPMTWSHLDIQLLPINLSAIAHVPRVIEAPVDPDFGAFCAQANVVLDVHVPESLPTRQDYWWALEKAKNLLSFSGWQPFLYQLPEDCTCAPQYPRLLWHVSAKGVMTAQEDRKAAAAFERGLKTRSPIFEIQATADHEATRVQIGLNIASLIHRARGRLSWADAPSPSWRLFTDHADLAPTQFPKYQLRSNSADVPYEVTPALSYLRGAQLRSLAWMRQQEQGRLITITEVEEAIHRELEWRLEARAEADITVRGGVLADLPSFGKTVTTIALVQNEFEERSPKDILRQNALSSSDLPKLLNTAATLIVCPPTIALQWQSELEKFLGEEYVQQNVLLIRSFEDLTRLSLQEAQECQIIIASWSVFAEDSYISELASFTAMPEPSVSGRRAFEAWQTRALKDVPDQIAAYQELDFSDFEEQSAALLESRLQSDEFQVTLPLKAKHGSAYQSFKSMQKISKAKAMVKAAPKRKSFRRSSAVPLLHLFRFNRIVVDEYHYLNDDKRIDNVLASVSVQNIAAVKRWVLSGTPALGSFSDVDQIASYLGLKLGRDYIGDGTTSLQQDRIRRKDQTLVEDFLSHTEVMSQQWHQGRHERAQEFLDLFVRQNEAELQHIDCSEEIIPVELDIAHHAVYLELSQHLVSQKMQMKKLKRKANMDESDRVDRLNASLNSSATAEDALLKSALLFETFSEDGGSGMDALMAKRSQQRSDAAKDLRTLMAGLEGLAVKDAELRGLYNHFKRDIVQNNWLGDHDASQKARFLLSKAQKAPIRNAFPELRGKSKGKTEVKKILSQLRETAQELALRTRSERFIANIQAIIRLLSGDMSEESVPCSSPSCPGDADPHTLCLVPNCGHIVCDACLPHQATIGRCVDPECSTTVDAASMIRVSSLGSPTALAPDTTTPHSFGAKLTAITTLISSLPVRDQALIFAPSDETLLIIEHALTASTIPFSSLRGTRPKAAASVIESFKSTPSSSPKAAKVLLLNQSSESAAGANLVNANHVVFVAPLLARSQYEFEAAMAQAVARCRRYGQRKKVRIYHVLAQRTLDVDVVERRWRRADGVTTTGSGFDVSGARRGGSAKETGAAKKEKVRMVANGDGDVALVPVSWVEDEKCRSEMQITDERFTSLIGFADLRELDED